MTDYHFGVEIEVIVEPHKIRPPLREKHALYYEKLAAALRNRGLKAKADSLQAGYSKRPEHYDKWWITKDGSLGSPENLIPMEAVSPVLRRKGNWEGEIDTFWNAMRAVFHMPERSSKCGSHIHISRGRGETFTLSQLKKIAYGVVLYEPLIFSLLMANRTNNQYCLPNSQNSLHLMACSGNWAETASLIKGAISPAALKAVMQENRYVLWNFENILPNKSGTVEFRGGRCLRGEVRTKRWIAFTISIVHALQTMDDISRPGTHSLAAWTPEALYDVIKKHVTQMSMRELLPGDYRVLNESING